MFAARDGAELLDWKISKRIGADDAAYFRYAVLAGDQMLFRVNVGSVIAGVEKRRG